MITSWTVTNNLLDTASRKFGGALCGVGKFHNNEYPRISQLPRQNTWPTLEFRVAGNGIKNALASIGHVVPYFIDRENVFGRKEGFGAF
jgi:hypothetical protein